MYMGEHTNVTEKLHDIQKQGRTKGSLLDHIAIPVTAFFVATDLMTVHLYTESLFDERPEMAMLVAASIALLLEICHHIGHHDASVHAGNWANCIDWRRSAASAHFWARPSEPLQSSRVSASCPRS